MSYTLETYEWDNTWIEQSNNITSKRVLYIGDSISCGTRTFANRLSKGEILIDGYGTSKALDNPYFFDSLSIFAKLENKRDAVIFNNGLHGWHLGEEEYERLYKEFLDKLAEMSEAAIEASKTAQERDKSALKILWEEV